MGADFRGDPARRCWRCSTRPRTTPSATTTWTSRSTSPTSSSSPPRTCSTRSRGRCSTGWRRSNWPGYTLDEKRHIARSYLVARQIAANGLKPSQIEFSDAALTAIVEEYTREAGVRNLERLIGTICRKVARQVAEGKAKGKVRVSAKKAREMLGRRRVFAETRRRTKDPGVATGLAWTPAGGDVLFIEATGMPGSGHLTITGQLGEVMKESAQAALSYVRGHQAADRAEAGRRDWFAEHDIHIHVPAGAVPKDGPSAGVAMTVALSSLISGRPVRNDVAMTGEVTLTGKVLPIGGLKEKSLGGAAGGDQAGDRARAQRGRRRRRSRPPSSAASSSSSSTRSRRRSTSRSLEWRSASAPAGRDRPDIAPAPARRPSSGSRAHSRAFWIVVGLTALAALLRFATLGVQSYHHDEIVTASRILRAGFGHAMHAVWFSESTPPVYYALAWVWTQLVGTGEFGLRSISARGRGGDGAGRLPDRGRAARPPRRPLGGGAGRGQPDDALVLAGGARLRAGRPVRRALGPLLGCGPNAAARRRDFIWWGVWSGAGARHPLLRRLPDPGRGADAAAPARAAGEPRRDRHPRRLRARRWRRWRSTRCRSGTPTGSATSPSAIAWRKRRRPSSPGRPATSSPGPSGPGWRSCRWP